MQFGLVHGAWHGAWCFEFLVEELEARGHSAVGVDLPCDDVEAGAVRYAEIVDAALPDDPALILVGHSLGGLTIPLVAARRPIGRVVFLCALVPVAGLSFRDQLRAGAAVFTEAFDDDPGRTRDPDGSTSWDRDAAVRAFYHDCPPGRARAAAARLRPQAPLPTREVCPPEVAFPAPASILCRDDRVIAPAWSREVARDRLGVDAIELEGGHSPFLSRPAELAAVLERLG